MYAHTGWRYINGEWLYLHASGAIGRDGRVASVHTELQGKLAGRVLPDPLEGAGLQAAILATIGLADVGPPEITVPLLCASYRAALGDSDSSIHLSGPTSQGKTALAALVQQHFGLHLDAQNLTTLASTTNAIEAIAFQVKDQIVLVNEFKPAGSDYDQQRWHAKADQVLRAKGNSAGRQRRRPDTTLRPEKRSRTLILSTGQDVPCGESLRARMLVRELGPDDTDWNVLTRCQREAASGLYAQAMSGYAATVLEILPLSRRR